MTPERKLALQEEARQHAADDPIAEFAHQTSLKYGEVLELLAINDAQARKLADLRRQPVRIMPDEAQNWGQGAQGHTVPVSAISPDDLREIGKAWTEALVAHALRRRTDGE